MFMTLAMLMLVVGQTSLADPVTFLSERYTSKAYDETSPRYHGNLPLQFTLFPPPPVGNNPRFFSADPHRIDNDPRTDTVEACVGDFSPDPNKQHQVYDATNEHTIYGGKRSVNVQRPLVELGIPFYGRGEIPVSQTWLGETNLVQQKYYLFGDYRAAFAQSNNIGAGEGDETTEWATRLNLELDWWFTATERIHAFIGPFQDGGDFLRFEDGEFFGEFNLFNADVDTFFFEGDLGQLAGGFDGSYAPFDIPVAGGLVPLLFQNGIWVLDAFHGAALTLPSRNNPWFDWSNYDITFFTGLDQVTSAAFDNALHSAQFFAATTFIEARKAYVEVGYGYVVDRGDFDFDRSYHNIGISYTRRYFGGVSNAIRVIVNAGQDAPKSERTADGILLLVENAFVSRKPYHRIPYINFFAGFGTPQPLARGAGPLFNTGISFQGDALTNFPTLDFTGFDTAGFSAGIELLGYPRFDSQLILETTILHSHGDEAVTGVIGDQYAIAARWQKPIDHRTLFRADAIGAITENSDDVAGVRAEYRWKF